MRRRPRHNPFPGTLFPGTGSIAKAGFYAEGRSARSGWSGGRSWWAHFEFTRINIAPTILPKKIEDLRGVGANAPVVRVLRRACGLGNVERLKDPDADGVLIVAKSDQGIDVCRAVRGKKSRDDNDEAENYRATDERDPIGRC